MKEHLPSLILTELSKHYGEQTVLDKLSMTVEAGTVCCISGPSGCGKTTLLRLIAGLEKPDHGSVTLPGPAAYVFQEPRLLPNLSALDNIAQLLPLPKEEARQEALHWLTAVGIVDEENSQNKLPAALSGGMQQRVGIARALAFCSKCGCKLLLLDEAFSSLDAERKEGLISLMKQALSNVTVVAVSHQPEEYEGWADRFIKL